MRPPSKYPRLTNKAIAAEVERLMKHRYSPVYIANIRNGNVISKKLQPLIAQAVENLRQSAT